MGFYLLCNLCSSLVRCDAKEKAIVLERQSVYERQKTLQQEQERLLDGQSLLNDREEHILGRSQELHRLEKQLEVSKGNLDKEVRALNVEKSNLELNMASLQIREEVGVDNFSLCRHTHTHIYIKSWIFLRSYCKFTLEYSECY